MDSYKNKVITSVEFDTMKRTYAELTFTEVEVRCTVLVHNNGEVDNRTIANTLRVDMKTIQRTHKSWRRVRIPMELSQDLQSLWTTAGSQEIQILSKGLKP